MKGLTDKLLSCHHAMNLFTLNIDATHPFHLVFTVHALQLHLENDYLGTGSSCLKALTYGVNDRLASERANFSTVGWGDLL